MLNLKAALAEDIAEGLRLSGLKVPKTSWPGIVVDRLARHEDRENEERGDYATPVALSLAKTLKMSPMDVVKVIAEHMPKKEYIGRLKVAQPGFLNIWLNPGWLTARLDNVIEEELSVNVQVGEGKSVNLEFISANPTGPLTLGNIRTAFSVDTLGNILEKAGYDVTREYYFNDSGVQIDKLGESVLRRTLIKRGEKLEYSEDLYQGDYIADLGEQVLEQWQEVEGRAFEAKDLADDKLVRRAGEGAATIMMSRIKKMIVDDLHIEFDVWTSEGELKKSGRIEEVLKQLSGLDLLYEKNGAKWIKTTKFGDDEDRVLVKSNGEYAYVAPDIAYHEDKYSRGFDDIFTFVGPDHQGHLPKVRVAMEALGHDVEHLHLVTSQLLRVIKDGKPVKLSKRAGQVVTPKDLIDEIGYDAARFFMVQHALTTHMDLDLDLAKERSERNPVYYVQYAYVRLQSIMRQAKQRGVITDVGERFDLTDSPELTHTKELDLMRQLYRYPEVVTEIATEFKVHDLAFYALDLAKSVHVWYRHVPVLSVEDDGLVKSRLQLVLAAKKVLGETLELMGLSKPDVM